MSLTLAAFLLLRVSGISNRQYSKEVAGILKADEQSIVAYQNSPPWGTDKGSVALYVTLIEWDIELAQRELSYFNHHKATREDVDRFLANLSRDLEDAPVIAPPGVVVPEYEATT